MRKAYRVIVYAAGNSTATTDFTIGMGNLGAAPTVGGQNVDIRRGTTESRPWQVSVVDASDYLSAKLAGSDGRTKLIGRICRAEVQKDGGSWTTLATGRITNISMGSDVVTYNITVQDERWIERGTNVWTDTQTDNDWPSTGAKKKAGTTLVPPGIDGEYGTFETQSQQNPIGGGAVIAKSGNQALITIDHLVAGPFPITFNKTLNPQTIEFLKDDIRAKPDWSSTSTSTTGNFQTVRVRIDGNTYGLHSIGQRIGHTGQVQPNLEEQIAYLENEFLTAAEMYVWVNWSTASAGDTVAEALVVASTHKPTLHVPLHIGGKDGIHPFTMARKLYDDAGVRYSTAAFDTLEQTADYLPMRFRVTAPERLSDFLNRAVYQPLGVTPFVNAKGRVAPVSIYLPQNVQSTGLFAFTSTNASDPHPEWHQQGRDLVTEVNFNYIRESQAILVRTSAGGIQYALELKDKPCDLLDTEELTITHTAPRGNSTSTVGMGTHKVDVDFSGYHGKLYLGRSTSGVGYSWHQDADHMAKPLSEELFDRYADGPIRGTVTGLSTSESVEGGDFVTLTVPTFPTPNTQSRGGTRVVQVMSRVDTPAGPDYEWLDAGAAAQPLTAPSLSISKSTVDPLNTIVATVGSLSTVEDAGWQLQTAVGSTEPAATSGKWNWSTVGDSTGDFPVLGYPSGQKVWGRVRQRAPGRIRSAWSTSASSTLGAITAPSSISISNSSGESAKVNWGLGSTKHETEVLHAESASTTSTLGAVATVPVGGRQYWLRGITKGSTNQVGVRHADVYGGRSATTRTEFVASTSNPDASGVRSIKIVVGTAV